jgi:hypothetical protein
MPNEYCNERIFLLAFPYARVARRPLELMRHVYKALCLMLLLIAAQQGAVVHELSHVSGAHTMELGLDSGDIADTTCALCPAFAQVVTPAFSHTFHIPLLARAQAERNSEPEIEAVDTAVPRPRSRGPPSRS